MGGKTWQQDEEELFWLELIPQSPEGLNPGSRKLSWKQIAEAMHRRLGSKGYRNYNHQLIYEHFYQNCKSNHPSPRAKAFVKDYMQRRGHKPIERPKEIKSAKNKTPAKRRTGLDTAGSTNPKRARQLVEVTQGAEGEQDAPGNGSLYSSISGDNTPAALELSEAARSASRVRDTDGPSKARYWTSGRVPLPSAPLSVATGVDQHAVKSTIAPARTTASSGETCSPFPDSDLRGIGDASPSTESTLLRPAPLPSMTIKQQFASENSIDIRADGIHNPLPSIHTLIPNTNAFRPARLVTPQDHGYGFEVLLSAASAASSSESSPDSLFSRRETFGDAFDTSAPSPATTVDEDTGAPPAVECVYDKGKGPARSQMQTICE